MFQQIHTMNSSTHDCLVHDMQKYHSFFRVPCPPPFLDHSTFMSLVQDQDLTDCDVVAIETTCALQRPILGLTIAKASACDLRCILLITITMFALLMISLVISRFVIWRRRAGCDDEKKVINDGRPVDL